MKSIFSVFILSLFLFSCTAKKVITQNPADVDAPVSDKAFFEKIKEPSDFEQVKINSKIKVETDAFIPTLDATIYIENGEKIWMNMTALLFNAGRGIATKDGIKGYEKWNKTYIDSDFTYLNKLLNINFIDYSSLQNLLLGKTFFPVNEKDFTLTKNPQGYTLTSNKNQIIKTDGKISEYSITADYNENSDLTKLTLNEIRKDENLEISYDNWISENNLRLPKNVKIIIKSSKTSRILIENTTFAFNKMETPYAVPANYKKTDIR